MKLENVNWENYYNKTEQRPPRPLLLAALELEKTNPRPNGRSAIDLGCGHGTDTLYLLENGWRVLAVDGESTAINRLTAKLPHRLAAQLQTQVAAFEQLILPPADLIYASLSLPFCQPAHFPELWQEIEVSLGRNGRFAGQFFGVNDSWAVNKQMTFHTESDVRNLFTNFELEYFHEEDKPGFSTSGPKHWHIFTLVARKQTNLKTGA